MYVNICKVCIGTESRCTHCVHVLSTGYEQGHRRNTLKRLKASEAHMHL